MISLTPLPALPHICPYDGRPLTTRGWYMPGMRMLAELHCDQCDRGFYGDLPSGHGLHYPMLLDRSSGEVHDRFGGGWFADALRNSFANRSNRELPLRIERLRELRHPIVLNCLDSIYGHALLRLLNAQYHLDHHPQCELLVIVPRWLRWLVPDGVAEIWTLDVPLRESSLWSDWLAQRIADRLEGFVQWDLSLSVPHPSPQEFDIERFTRVAPFDPQGWSGGTSRPVVTYLWRDDRPWLGGFSPLRGRRYVQRWIDRLNRAAQSAAVMRLERFLRRQFPGLDFAVAGVASAGGLPTGILDLRRTRPETREEHQWCRRYASSHIVIGVQGSNLLLPTALAGAAVCLVERWRNLGQDILLTAGASLDPMLRCHFLPRQIGVRRLGSFVAGLLHGIPAVVGNFQRRCQPLQRVAASPWGGFCAPHERRVVRRCA